MDNSNGLFNCIKCNKSYSSYKSLWNHNKKYHSSNILKISDTVLKNSEINNKSSDKVLIPSEIIEKSYNCRNCNKIYNNIKTRWSHEKICKTKTNILEENNKLKENLIKLEKENEQLKNTQLIPINNNKTNNKNKINNGVINKNNGTINNTLNKNNYLYINQIGNEKVDLTAKEIKLIVNDGLNGAMTCIKSLNFNSNKPENHSFYSNSLEGQFCTAINQKTQKPETLPKKEIVDRALESSFKILEGISIQIECDDDFREQFTEDEIGQLHNIINNKNKFYEKKNRKIFHNSVIGMSYTFKHLIMSTWELLQPDYEEDDEDLDTDSIPDITEMHFDPNDISGVTKIKPSENNDDSDDEFTFKIKLN